MLSSLTLGIIGGVLVFLLWWLTEYIRLCLLINGLFLGFLVAGCMMFSPVGKYYLSVLSALYYSVLKKCFYALLASALGLTS